MTAPVDDTETDHETVGKAADEGLESEDDGSWQEWQDALLLTMLSLFCVLCFQVIGGWCFYALEYDNEKSAAEEFKALQTVTRFCRARMQHIMLDQGLCSIPDPDRLNWAHPGAAFFAMTLSTTIGYGTFAPATDGGKAFTVVFGIFGIALFSWFLTNQETVNELIEAAFWRRVKGRDVKPSATERIVVCIIAVFVLCLIGCGIFTVSQAQDLTFFEAIYFGLITMTTIGLGDYAPDVGDPNFTMWSFMLFSCWTKIGLSVVAHLLAVIGKVISDAGDAAVDKVHYLEKAVTYPSAVFGKVKRSQVAPISQTQGDAAEPSEGNGPAPLGVEEEVIDLARVKTVCEETDLSAEEATELAALLSRVPLGKIMECYSGSAR